MPWLTPKSKRQFVKKHKSDLFESIDSAIYLSPVTGWEYKMLPGYFFDGASIMWWYRWRFKPDGWWLLPSWLHDLLYGGEIHSRGTCDEVFERSMQEYREKSRYVKNLFFIAVRIGGGSVWDKHTPDTIAYARKYLMVKRPNDADFINSSEIFTHSAKTSAK